MNKNKKILFIGDIHGRNDWKEIALEALLNFRDIIFVGDYADSFDISPALCIYNLKEIIEFKKKHMDKVTLLLGNHDWAYIHDRMGISGFNLQSWQDYKKIFQDNNELFDIAYGHTNPHTQKYTLVTHAGLTYKFWMNYILPIATDPESTLYKLVEGDVNKYFLHEVLNFLRDNDVLWKVGDMRGGVGTPGVLWADYLELLEDPYPEINQVFGHTAAGTVTVDQFGDYFLAKVDGFYNKKLAHLQLNI